MSINVCSKLSNLRSKESIKLDLPDTSFNTSVEVLRQLITNRLELSNEVDLIAFGKILKDDKSLAFYGIKGTTTIYVIKKRDVSHITCISAEAIEAARGSQAKPEGFDVKSMAGALKMALRSAEFRTMLTRLNNREDREKLMAFTPGLREDPIVLAILQDPDLLALCTENADNFSAVVELHPLLAVAAENLAATFHEENPDFHLNSIRVPDQMRYGLDDSDDDDDDEGAAAAPQPQPASADVLSRMLRQALDSAHQQRRQQAGAQAGTSASSSSTSQSSEPTSRSVSDGHLYLPPRSATASVPRSPVRTPISQNGGTAITPAMLQAALASTLGNPNPVRQQPPPPTPQSTSSVTTQRDWSVELNRLRELGVTNEAYAVHVLEATNGDVEAAANIILMNQ